METTIHDLAIETIHARETQPQPGDALGACVLDALAVGTRVCPREPPPEPSPLPRLLVEALVGSTTWRD